MDDRIFLHITASASVLSLSFNLWAAATQKKVFLNEWYGKVLGIAWLGILIGAIYAAEWEFVTNRRAVLMISGSLCAYQLLASAYHLGIALAKRRIGVTGQGPHQEVP